MGGISVRVDASWAIGVFLVTYSLWIRFTEIYRQLASGAALALAVLASVLFFGSVLVHELAHAGMARARGIAVSGITLFLFGGATGARLEDRGPGDEFVVTVVGPGASLALAGVFWGVAQTGAVLSEPVAGAFGYVGWVNLLLAAFNVVPGFPLDGGRMLRAVLWRFMGSAEQATRIAASVGQAVGLLLIAAGVWLLTQEQTFSAIWMAAIGWMLYTAARGATRESGVRRALAEGTAGQAMGPPPATIPAGISLSESLSALMGNEHETFPVVEGDLVVGLLTFAAARRIGRRDPLRPVREAMLPLSEAVVADPDEPLDRVTERLGSRRGALVLRDGRLVGSITRRDLVRWLSTRPVP